MNACGKANGKITADKVNELEGIAHYLGDRSAPEALLRAEDAVDTAANVEQWIGVDTYRKPYEQQLCK